MSYAAPVAGPSRRPTVVTTAGYLLYLLAVLLVISAVLPLVSSGKVADALRQAYAGSTSPKPDDVANVYRAVIIVVFVLYLLVAIGIAILAMFDLRGKQAARIITWVITGVGVLCFGCGIGGSFATRIDTTTSSGNGTVDQQEVNRLVNNAEPSWLGPLSRVLSVLGLIVAIVVIILLALPAANPYFRGGAGVPGAAQPPYPAYPAYPAYPPAPGYPPAQPGTGYPPATGTPYPPAPPTEQPPANQSPPAEQPPTEQPPTPPAS